MTIYHRNLTGSEVHVPNAFTYANAAQRLVATGFVASDVNKWALDSDTNLYHVLKNHDPITWEPISPKTGTAIGDLVKLVDVAGAAGLPSVDGTQLSGLLKTSTILNINPSNLLYNGNFEDWYAGTTVAPTGWLFGGAGGTIARTTGKKIGTYAAYFTRVGTDCFLYQDIQAEKGIDYWKGRQVTFGCWVFSGTPGAVRLQISDGGGSPTISNWHNGTAWEYLTVTHTVASNATVLRPFIIIVGVDTSVYVDGAMCVEGPNAFAFSDEVHSLKSFVAVGSRALDAATGSVIISTVPFRPISITALCIASGDTEYSSGIAHYNYGAVYQVCTYRVHDGTQSASGSAIGYINPSAGNAVSLSAGNWTTTGVTLTFTKTGSPVGTFGYYILFQG